MALYGIHWAILAQFQSHDFREVSFYCFPQNVVFDPQKGTHPPAEVGRTEPYIGFMAFLLSSSTAVKSDPPSLPKAELRRAYRAAARSGRDRGGVGWMEGSGFGVERTGCVN